MSLDAAAAGQQLLPAEGDADPAPRGENFFHLEAERTREQWEAMSDLDLFFTRVYTYFRERGFFGLLLSRLMALLTLLFTIFASYFAVVVVNWHDLLHVCVDEASCARVTFLVPASERQPSLFMLCYVAVFCVYFAWQLLHLVHEMRFVVEVRALYETKLGLDDAALQQVSWDEVCRRLCEYQRRSKFCIVKDELTALDVAMRIMRRENWLIAMVSADVLPLDVPIPGLGSRNLLSKTLEWNLYTLILDSMYDGQFRVRRQFLADAAALRRRMVVTGLINLALLPFSAAFMSVFFFLRHAEEYHRHPGSIGARAFTPYALWRFREYNELPHVFDARMRGAYADANAFVHALPARQTGVVARFVSFVFGSFAALAIVVSVLNQEVLLHCRVGGEEGAGGHNLLWWLALFSTVLAVSRAFCQDPEDTCPDQALERVSMKTHHFPAHWRGGGLDPRVAAEFKQLFEYKVVTLCLEILSCVATPFTLCLKMPEAVDRVLAFVASERVHVDGIGDVCRGSRMIDDGGADGQGVGAGVGSGSGRRGVNAKRAQSLRGFAAHHPSLSRVLSQRSALAASDAVLEHLDAVLYNANNNGAGTMSSVGSLRPRGSALMHSGVDWRAQLGLQMLYQMEDADESMVDATEEEQADDRDEEMVEGTAHGERAAPLLQAPRPPGE